MKEEIEKLFKKEDKKLIKLLLELSEIAKNIARYGGDKEKNRDIGCIFVIKQNDFEYEPMIEQDVKFNIFDDNHRFEVLGIMDGACVVDIDGNLLNYCVRIKDVGPVLKGFGTRHNASFQASLKNNFVIMASGSEKKVKILKSGKILCHFDALAKSDIANENRALELIAVGSVPAVGIPLATQLMNIPITSVQIAVGVALGSGIVVYGWVSYLSKKLEYLYGK